MCHSRKQNPAAVSGGSPAGQSAGTVRLSHTAWLTGMLFLLFAGLFWLGYISGGFSRNTVSAGWENSSFHSADCGRVNESSQFFRFQFSRFLQKLRKTSTAERIVFSRSGSTEAAWLPDNGSFAGFTAFFQYGLSRAAASSSLHILLKSALPVRAGPVC